EEQDAVKRGDLDDKVGVSTEDILERVETERRRRIIKTLQQKNFLKIGRVEFAPGVAFVANDPFLKRYIAGASVGYHWTEIFEIEASLSFAPDLGERDWKALTTQLVEENHVSPDISKLQLFGSTVFSFSPIYGKVAFGQGTIINFDIFGLFGMGAAQTVDDLKALQAENDDRAEVTKVQIHPTTNFGGGFRIIFNESLALRLEGRSLVYIETVSSTTLEMKNNFIVRSSVAFFVPRIQR
ncbi:MAG: outer membrane beta-barrel domain-containing protein, partial [Myxococcota bacterium]|nr:outer membrane beta-barrel domain-containing protein [Myxococcota bacterium]